MKRIVVGVLALLVIGTMAFGQTQVLSRNAVGYVKLDLVTNYNMIAVNWLKVGAAGISVQELLDTSSMQKGNSFLNADNLILWDPVGQGYQTLFLYSSPGSPAWDGKWVAQGPVIPTNMLYNGDAAWFRRRGSSNIVSYIMGEVPADSSNVTSFVQGYNMFGSGFTSDFEINSPSNNWTGAKKGSSFLNADNIIIWDASAQTYQTLFLYNSPGSPAWDGKWVAQGPVIATNVLKVGQGAWFRRRDATPFNWSEKKPYTWPN